MAKKNSTKTATKEARQASEPKVQVFTKWAGMNIADVPLEWTPVAWNTPEQSDLPMNYLVLQNNLVTTAAGTVETRSETRTLAIAPAGIEFTGVAHLWQDNLICAFSDMSLRYHSLSDAADAWTQIVVSDPDGGGLFDWASINWFAGTLICFTENRECFVGDLSMVSSSKRVSNPTSAPNLQMMGDLSAGSVSRISICYAYSNRFGVTEGSGNTSGGWATITVDRNPVEFSSAAYIRVTGVAPVGYDITGVELYCVLDENQDAIFIGHVNLTDGGVWQYNWLGALSDTTVWTNVPLTIPTDNTTKGVNARFSRQHDGRLYFWGGDEPYRLWIGGNPGSELSIARGLGGGFVDIEPGSGHEVKGTAKFKTYNGATITTIMCGNPNTGAVKRFNLLETNITVTNEIASKGYMTEEVSNVVGCNSHWGFGVWADGLYSVFRYGLALTTQAMESQNQLRVQYVSEAISPVFDWKLATAFSNARMIQIDDVIYLVLAQTDTPSEYDLDRVILCYDIGLKCWYTFTHESDERILHVLNIDSEAHWEGVGIITPTHIDIIQTTQRQDLDKSVDVLLRTGELSTTLPLQAVHYLNQIEVRFDYFVGDLEITIEGIDWYGRHFTVDKTCSACELRRDWAEWIRIDKLVESYRITMKGNARLRLTHILAKVYQQSKKMNQVYGFDDRISYINRDGNEQDDHHYISDYNNLREALVT